MQTYIETYIRLRMFLYSKKRNHVIILKWQLKFVGIYENQSINRFGQLKFYPHVNFMI